jgi:bifunctional DNA-binding transcriptional regulator/antitoxin component of YhaV-PrlF toxin-antitoxin module
MESTLTAKHQFTVPAKLARSLGWAPGTRLIFSLPDPQGGEFHVRRLDVAKARQELARAVAQFHERLADPNMSEDDLVEQAKVLVVAIRRFEEEMFAVNSAVVIGRTEREAQP